ncbi:hypothetical protein DIPPA_16946 [Diplonema papillatum]|nr:hypothetical protein DIPPA_16946 [Diplonema papillatum]
MQALHGIDRTLARRLAERWNRNGRAVGRAAGHESWGRDGWRLLRDVEEAERAGGKLLVYTTALAIAAENRDLARVTAIEAMMRRSGVAHDVWSTTAVMSVLAHHGDVAGTHRRMANCDRLAAEPFGGQTRVANNPATLNAVIHAHVQARDPRGALAAFREAETRLRTPPILLVDTALRAFDSYPEAKAFLAENCEKHRTSPTRVSYHNLLSVCSARGDVAGAREVVAEMEAEGHPLTEIVVTLLMCTYRKAGRAEEAVALYPRAAGKGAPASQSAVKEFIRCVGAVPACAPGAPELVDAALREYQAVTSPCEERRQPWPAAFLSTATALLACLSSHRRTAEAKALADSIRSNVGPVPQPLLPLLREADRAAG